MGIKSLELEPTKENILNTLKSDLIDRNESIWRFVRFCNAQEGKCSIAIDAQWGHGKTFFVKQAIMLLEAYNVISDNLTEEEREIILSSFSQYTAGPNNSIDIQPHVCVYYDAWSNDNDVDPILSIVYEITKTVACDYSAFKSRDYTKLLAEIFDFFTGKNVQDFMDALHGDDPLARIKEKRDIHETIGDFLDSLLPEHGNRLVVFIDELDRCKPDYAVLLLERIKHYFFNDRITFVFSVNLEELQHTIKRFYGEGFDACKYLDRFFDYRIALPPANMTRYYQKLGLNSRMYVYDSVCKAVIEYYGFGLREVEKYYRMTKIAASDPAHSNSFFGFTNENALQFSLCIVVPIVIGLRMTDLELYNDFISGKNSGPLLAVLGDGEIAGSICSLLLDRTETFDKEARDQRTTVLLSDKLNAAYKALFGDDGSTVYRMPNVGKCSFSQETKEAVMRATSLMSKFARLD